MEPLPSLRRVFSHITGEESRFFVDKDHVSKPEAKASFYTQNGGRQKKRDGPRPKCDHYGKIGHVKAKCFEIIGYPDDWDTLISQRGQSKNVGQSGAHHVCVDERQKDDNPDVTTTQGHTLCTEKNTGKNDF